MAREFAKAFYNSILWKRCRERYIQSMPIYKRGLCEKCYDKGNYQIGEEVHHKIWLTPSNINDTNITLNHNNLILLCYECHKKEHHKQKEKRFTFDDEGNIIPNDNYE